jgi:hypothetical protein
MNKLGKTVGGEYIIACTKSKIADYKVPKATEFFTLCPEV